MEMCALVFLSGVGEVHLRASYMIREEECVAAAATQVIYGKVELQEILSTVQGPDKSEERGDRTFPRTDKVTIRPRRV